MSTPSTPQHTPGPWRLSVISSRKVLDAADNVICTVGRKNTNEGDRWPEDVYRQFLANAQLIAAAPETAKQLLEARDLLKRTASLLTDLHHDHADAWHDSEIQEVNDLGKAINALLHEQA